MARVSIDSARFIPDSGGEAAHAGVASDLVDGNVFTNDGSIVLVVQNTDASPANLTIDIPDTKNVDGQAVPSKVVAIPATSTRYFRFPVAQYGTKVGINGAAATLVLSLIR
jgi:hypothetical protein